MPLQIGNNSSWLVRATKNLYDGGYSIPSRSIIRTPCVRATRSRPGMHVRVKCTRLVQDPGDTISFKDQDQDYSVALHRRPQLSLNIPGVLLTSP